MSRLRRRLLIGLAAVVGLVLFAAAAGYVYLLTLPGVGDAEARVAGILAEHGGVAAALPPPRRLGEAVVAVEDEHFYSNVAVNVVDGAGRAALAAVSSSEDPGGSTIGQQLAKRLYPHGSGVFGTLEEIGVAVKLSLHYSAPAILGMYLNSVYFGHGYWGDVAASHGYFGVSPRRLSWAQASLLAGLPQAPSAYDPLRHLALARSRQHHVLDQLAVNGYLSERRAAAAFHQPLALIHGS
jgi:penicillin-binding protein 1A